MKDWLVGVLLGLFVAGVMFIILKLGEDNTFADRCDAAGGVAMNRVCFSKSIIVKVP